jgi:hypothetical protein
VGRELLAPLLGNEHQSSVAERDFFKSVSQIPRGEGGGSWKFWQLSIYIIQESHANLSWKLIKARNKRERECKLRKNGLWLVSLLFLLHLILQFHVMMFFIENIYHVYLETVTVIGYNVLGQMVPYRKWLWRLYRVTFLPSQCPPGKSWSLLVRILNECHYLYVASCEEGFCLVSYSISCVEIC